MIITEEGVYTHSSRETGGTEYLAGPPGEAEGSVRGRGQGKESLVHSLYWRFREKERQGRGNSLGLVSLNNYCRLWAIGLSGCLSLVVWFLALG